MKKIKDYIVYILIAFFLLYATNAVITSIQVLNCLELIQSNKENKTVKNQFRYSDENEQIDLYFFPSFIHNFFGQDACITIDSNNQITLCYGGRVSFTSVESAFCLSPTYRQRYSNLDKAVKSKLHAMGFFSICKVKILSGVERTRVGFTGIPLFASAFHLSGLFLVYYNTTGGWWIK